MLGGLIVCVFIGMPMKFGLVIKKGPIKMPRRHDPINDFFNELLDATVTTLIDTMRPEFRKLAKSAVEQAKAKADAKAKRTKPKTDQQRERERFHQRVDPRRVTPPQLTLYDVLEVSPRASHETIEAAYKSLARRYHPDVGGSLSLMQDITNAYGVLKDKVARHKYDRSIGLHG